MMQPSGRLAASRRAQRSKAVVGHHSQFVPEHTYRPAMTTNEKTVIRHSLGLWFCYSGRLPKSVEIADRAPFATAFAAAVQGAVALARRWASARRARSCGVRDTRGGRATRRSLACGEWPPRGLPPALRIPHRLRVAARQQEHAGPRALGGFELARLHSLRALVSKGLARDESDASVFFSSPSGGRPGEGWGRLSHRLPHPHWHVAPSVGRAATSSPIAGDREIRRARRLKPAAHCVTLPMCRCHKSTSRLT